MSTCDHNCIPCRGGLRHLFRAGWVCVRCDRWFRTEPPRTVTVTLGASHIEWGPREWPATSATRSACDRP